MAVGSELEPLSPGELGLLTVAERRGEVRVPAVTDDRTDVAAIERQALLARLVDRGLVAEVDAPPGERVYAISNEGKAALARSDRPGDPPPSWPA